MICQTAARWVRIRVKVLWLALRIRLHTRQVRALNAKIVAHMAKYPKQMQDERRKFLLAQLKRMQEQEAMIQIAAKTVAIGLKMGLE